MCNFFWILNEIEMSSKFTEQIIALNNLKTTKTEKRKEKKVMHQMHCLCIAVAEPHMQRVSQTLKPPRAVVVLEKTNLERYKTNIKRNHGIDMSD
jgi:hypothetical protein